MATEPINYDDKPYNRPEPVNFEKKTPRAVELERLLKYKLRFSAVEELVKIYRKDDTKDADKIRIALELLGYQFPKFKPVEVDPNQGEKINVNIVFPTDTAKAAAA